MSIKWRCFSRDQCYRLFWGQCYPSSLSIKGPVLEKHSYRVADAVLGSPKRCTGICDEFSPHLDGDILWR